MNLIRYQSYPSFAPSRYPSLLAEMDRLFEAALPASGESRPPHGRQFPIDLYQGKESFTLRAEMPGFRKEDLTLDLADGVLTVNGHQKESAATDNAAAIPERRVSRAISLPEEVDVEKIQASYENGVLTVTLPKREEVKPRQIAIEVK